MNIFEYELYLDEGRKSVMYDFDEDNGDLVDVGYILMNMRYCIEEMEKKGYMINEWFEKFNLWCWDEMSKRGWSY